MRRRIYVAGLTALLLGSAMGCSARTRPPMSNGASYAGDRGSSKYAPLDQINKDNVAELKIAWRRPAVDGSLTAKMPDLIVPRDFRATPLMIKRHTVQFERHRPCRGVPAGNGAHDLGSGAVRGGAGARTFRRQHAQRRLLGGRRLRAGSSSSAASISIALDANHGKPIADWGDGGRVESEDGSRPARGHL